MHLLVVEDDPRLSRLLKRLLEDDRHVVELATHGRAGVELAEDAPGIECLAAGARPRVSTARAPEGAAGPTRAACPPGMEGVILDVGVPDIGGLDVARQLRTGGSEVPIL